MIDFENLLKVDERNIVASFDEIALKILKGHELEVNKINYEIIEIEFYYNSLAHNDLKVIKRDKNIGNFFFHDYGIDICFQTKDNDIFGGILLRSIKSEGFVNGPIKVQSEILNNYNAATGLLISLIEIPLKKNIPVFKSKRIVQQRDNYILQNAKYRYAVRKDEPDNRLKNKELFSLILE